MDELQPSVPAANSHECSLTARGGPDTHDLVEFLNPGRCATHQDIECDSPIGRLSDAIALRQRSWNLKMKATVRIAKNSGISGSRECRSESRCAVLIQESLVPMEEAVPTFCRERCPGTVKSDQIALFEVDSRDS